MTGPFVSAGGSMHGSRVRHAGHTFVPDGGVRAASAVSPSGYKPLERSPGIGRAVALAHAERRMAS